MTSYLNSSLSYIWSLSGTTPAKPTLSPAQVTLKEKQAVYQELFDDLLRLKSHLDAKEYPLFQERWSHLADYQDVWTPELKDHLDPQFDAQFFSIWLDPKYTAFNRTLDEKLKGCISLAEKLGSDDSLSFFEIPRDDKQAVIQELFQHLTEMKGHLDRKEFGMFAECWDRLKEYQEVWTSEMRQHLDPQWDRQFFEVWCDRGFTVLQQKLRGCLAVIEDLADQTS